MSQLDEVKGKRHRLTSPFGNGYLFVGPSDLMMTVAEENNPVHGQLRAMTEAICRLASKGMKERLTMGVVAEQLRKADSGRCKILSDIAECIEGG
jgi:2-keto-3-deoxy-L-rhamnonate aldolase RhmA